MSVSQHEYIINDGHTLVGLVYIFEIDKRVEVPVAIYFWVALDVVRRLLACFFFVLQAFFVYFFGVVTVLDAPADWTD